MSPLRHLVNILSDAVERIDEKYASAELEFPTLDKLFDEKEPAWLLLSDSDVVPLSSLIVAAANQLTVSVRHPMQAVYEIAQSHTIIACLRLVCETNVAEILHEAGQKGLHVNDIAAKNSLHPGKLARALRLLATYHVFTEVSPDVFANNSLSSILDTGTPVEALFTQPKADKFKSIRAKHCALIELTTDETMKSCSFITDTLLDPAKCHSEEPSDAPCMRVFQGKDYFDHLYAPGNEYRSARFQAAMGGLSSSDSSSTVIPGGFPWETLPKGTKIVDVGGGVGGACLEIMKKNPHLKFTVQDLPSVIDQTIAFWNRNEPKAIADGKVGVQAHSFFSPQPVKDADVFLLRYILHDWSNSKAIEILKRLREAATPGKTRVVVIDGVLKYACAVDQSQVPGAEDIVFEGQDKSDAPTGLLPNLGRAEARNYTLDLGMLALFNGQERTLGDHIWVMEASGWKILKIYSPGGRRISHVVAEAV